MLFSKTLHKISRRPADYSKRREVNLLHRNLMHTPGLIRSSCKMAQVALIHIGKLIKGFPDMISFHYIRILRNKILNTYSNVC